MYQGTTPSLLLEVEDYDLTNATVFVTFKTKSGGLLTKTGDALQISGSNIIVGLTQKETFSLTEGPCQLQVRFITSDGKAWATDKAVVNVEKVLYQKEIKYEGGGGE